MKKRLLFLIVALAAGLFQHAAANSFAATPAAGSGVRFQKDITYAKAGGVDLKLDLYIPAGPHTGSPPLIVWIHGGGWTEGTKAHPPLMFMVDHGFALASVEYRMSQQAKYPAQIYDCKAAIRWLRAHAREYGYDGTRIGAAGGSAGGHLVALLGVGHGVKALEGDEGHFTDVSSNVQAVCDAFGPTDLLHYPDCLMKKAADALVSKLLGGMPADKPQLARLASPIYFVDATDPPFFIIHGQLDPLVPVSQSQKLHDALVKVGVHCEILIDPLGGHGSHIFNDGTAFKRIESFFEKELHFHPHS